MPSYTASNKKTWSDTSQSFSGCDMVAAVDLSLPDGKMINSVIGSIQTLSYSSHMDKGPVRALGNMNAKDYVYGPRTIAGSLMFAVFDRHWAYRVLDEIRTVDQYKQLQFLIDELPPFNITITYVNEMGQNARLALYGVRTVTEGMVMSVNDIYTENTYQFVATGLDYLANYPKLTSSGLRTTKTNAPIAQFKNETDETAKDPSKKDPVIQPDTIPVTPVDGKNTITVKSPPGKVIITKKNGV